jgi:hypothetical protein
MAPCRADALHAEGEMVTLLNPRISDESAETDEQYALV